MKILNVTFSWLTGCHTNDFSVVKICQCKTNKKALPIILVLNYINYKMYRAQHSH